jgi:hypothetical protein
MNDANECISPRIGLPHMPVVIWPESSDTDDKDERDGLHWKTRTLVAWAAGRPFALVAIQPEWACGMGRWRGPPSVGVLRCGVFCLAYGAAAGGSQGPLVNSMVSASRASMPHLAVVDR